MIHLIRKTKVLKKNIIYNISRGFKREVVPSDFDVNHRPKSNLDKVQKEKLDINKEYIKSITEKYDVENQKWCEDIDNFNARED